MSLGVLCILRYIWTARLPRMTIVGELLDSCWAGPSDGLKIVLLPPSLCDRDRERRATSIDRSTPTSAAARRLRGLASALLPDYNSPSRTEKQTNKQTEKHSETKHIPAPTRVFFFFLLLLLTRVSHHRVRCMVAPRGELNKLCTRLWRPVTLGKLLIPSLLMSSPPRIERRICLRLDRWDGEQGAWLTFLPHPRAQHSPFWFSHLCATRGSKKSFVDFLCLSARPPVLGCSRARRRRKQ